VSEAIPPNAALTAVIDDLCEGVDLTSDTAASVLAEVMEGRVNEAQTSGFLIALRAKGETAAEVAGLARTMRAMATPVAPSSSPLVDTAGTGGGASTFNVSTTAALIAAGAGVHMAKHGNRSATSRSGSADVLEALGVPINLSPDQIAESIDSVGFGFMFAPGHHSATRFVVPVRMALGTRTVFNILGPLTNPAGARRQVIGVGDRSKVTVVAEALVELGCERALVINSDDGLDEISIAGTTTMIHVRSGKTETLTVSPEDAGLQPSSLTEVAGGSPEENAAVTVSILAGERGAHRDLAVLNAAAAIMVGGDGDDFAACARLAEAAIDDGAAANVLSRLVEFGQQ
jgi:anthranilate phosphoribosyltransferase